MYTVLDYAHMAVDGLRMDAYARAIARSVKPGSVVVDIGCGSGMFALLAARAGARQVHAIETNPAVWLLRDLAAENGLADRITVHHGSSLETELPEKADVIISDLRGSFPLYEGHLESLLDARRRLLAPGGTLMPQHDTLFVSLVELDPFWRTLELGWTSLERRGFTGRAARVSVLNAVYSDTGRPVGANEVLTEPRAWADVRYGEEYPRVFEATVELSTKRGGTAHAVAVWFDATVVPGIGYSTAPGNVVVYKRTLLPLLAPLTLAHGDVVELTLRVDVGGERWAWDTTARGAGGAPRERFRQATFLGKPTSPEALMREASGHVPLRSGLGDRAKKALELMDGEHSVEGIAAALGGTPASLDEVRELVRRYAR